LRHPGDEPAGPIGEQRDVAAGAEGQRGQHPPVRPAAAVGGGSPEVRRQQRHQQRLGQQLGEAAAGGVGGQVRQSRHGEGDQEGTAARHRLLPMDGGAQRLWFPM
jgi:peptidoglycan hydrolase-like protein with peptidoglycan-binding domain